MSVNTLSWSEERQQSLHEYLQGLFASDAWRVGPTDKPEKQSTLDFSPLQSNSLKIELKYAVWCKFQRKEWDIEGGRNDRNRQCLRTIITWLNRIAPGGQSLLEKSLALWELSLRSFLIETGKYRVVRPPNKYVNAQQVLVYHQDRENEVVRWFRQMYKIVRSARSRKRHLGYAQNGPGGQPGFHVSSFEFYAHLPALASCPCKRVHALQCRRPQSW